MALSFSISDLAKEFQVTTRSLRFYEEKGLLAPKRNNQTRIYSAADRTRLKLILRGKRLGLSLDESADIINLYNPNSRANKQQVETLVERIQQKRQQLLTQQEDLNNMLQHLQQVEADCLKAISV